MPNEGMGSRTLPEPSGVATGIVMIAVAAFLGLVAVMMAVLFFLSQSRRAERSRASDRTCVSRAHTAEKAAG